MSEHDLIAQASYRELLQVLQWFAQSGPTPTLIGGWAVWLYNSYLGSIDIDIVGPSLGGSFDQVIEVYERIHEYERIPRDELGIELSFRKAVKDGERVIGYFEIDACSFERDTGTFHEDVNKTLPYRLCEHPSYITQITLNHNAICFIPRKELLFLYKLKAERDRAFDLATRGAIMSSERRNWLRAKLSKDRSDLIALLDPAPRTCVITQALDPQNVHDIIETRQLHFMYSSIHALPTRNEAIQRYQLFQPVTPQAIEQWIQPLLIKTGAQ